MSQFGMQMPGGMQRRGPSLNVYTGLMLCAVIALLAACIVVYMYGSKIGHKGNPLETHTRDDKTGAVKAIEF